MASMTAIEIYQHLLVGVIALVIGLLISLIAWKAGYYRLPLFNQEGHIKLKSVIEAFVVFMATELIIVPSLYIFWLSWQQGAFVNPTNIKLDPLAQAWLNLLGVILVAVFLWGFYLTRDPSVKQEVTGGRPPSRGWQWCLDLLLGVLTWIIVYPWIVVIGQFITAFLETEHYFTHVDQVAVKHVKDAMTQPLLLTLTTLTVVTIIPTIEELLFRGFLQGWLKSLMGKGWAIVVTSAIFALFHYSASQKIENIEILLSLFILACYLGFIRERQGSLLASIGLHATFNAVSLGMILAKNL